VEINHSSAWRSATARGPTTGSATIPALASPAAQRRSSQREAALLLRSKKRSRDAASMASRPSV
jgi:hypothetical protein